MADTVSIIFQAQDRASGVISNITRSLSGMATVAGGVIGANLFGSLASGIQSSINAGMEFGSVVNRIQAVSGAGADAVQKITDKALQLGKDLPLSAKDAADGMYALATAGFSVEESIGAAEGVARLASSQMMEVGQASEIVAVALRGFGLEADQATRAVDVLSQIASTSAAEISDIGETLKYVGPVAGAAGQSLEDMGAAIGLMANQGIKGGMAGTALRATLTRLINPPKEAAAVMRQLGIEITDGSARSAKSIKELERELKEFKATTTAIGEQRALTTALAALGKDIPMTAKGAVDATTAMGRLKEALEDTSISTERKEQALAALGIEYTKNGGKMLGFVEIARQFRSSMQGMSEAERTAAAAALVGQEAMAGFLAVVNASDEDFNKMVGSMQNAQGATDNFSKAMNKGLGFELQQLQGSLETLGIKGFGAVEPYLVSFAQTATGQVNRAIEVFGRLQEVFKQTSGMSAGIQTQSILTALGLDGDIAARVGQAVNGVIVAVQTGMGRLQQVMGILSSGASAGGKAGAILQVLGLDPGVATRVGGAVDGIISAVQTGMGRLQQIIGVLGSGASAGGKAGAILQVLGLDPEVATRISGAIDTVITAVQGGLARVQQVIGILQSGTSAGGMAGGILQVLGLDPAIATRVSGVIDNIVSRVQTGFAGLMTALQPAMPVLQGLVNLVQTQVMPALTTLAGIVSGVLMAGFLAFWGFVSGAMPGVGTVIAGAVQVAVGAFQLLVGTVSGIINTISALLRGDWQSAWTAAQQTVQNISQGVQGILTGMETIVRGIIDGLVRGIIGAFTLLVETITGRSMPELARQVERWWSDIQTRTIEIVQRTVNEATSFFQALPGRIASAISGGISVVAGAVSDLGDRAMSILNDLADRAWDAGAGMIDAFRRGIMARLDDALSAARNMVSQIRDLLPGSDARRGPLSDLTASGRALPTTLAQGVLYGRAEAVDAARRVAGDMLAAWQTGIGTPTAAYNAPFASAFGAPGLSPALSVAGPAAPVSVSFAGANIYVQSRDDIDLLAETIAARIQRRAGGR